MEKISTGNANNVKPQKLNTAMLILQCIGIVAVVLGHADIGGKDIPNPLNLALPYYSWHMPFFIFISGYFFDRTQPMGKYLLKKVKNHLLPAFVVNAVCGVFSMCIKHFSLASYGQDITLKSLFVTPFTTGYQFYINISLWFVFALVVIEVLACFMDRITCGKADLIYLAVTFIISLYCSAKVYYDYESTRGEYYNALLRLGYLMFFFWLGACYRKYAETRLKRILNIKLSAIIFVVLTVFWAITNYKITTNTRDMNFIKITVPNGFWVAVVMPIIAIAFFLGVAYTLSPHFKNSTVLARIGRGTKYVMYYHQLIFVLCSFGLGVLTKLSGLNIEGFSFDKMAKSAYYTGGNVGITVAVALAALLLPILICSYISQKKPYIKVILYTSIFALIVLYLYVAGVVLN